MDVPQPPRELVRALAAGECALYAGAGLSARAGLPVWKGFVKSLLEWSTRRLALPESLVRSLTESLPTDPKLVADTLISRFRTEDEQLNAPNVPKRGREPPISEVVEYVRGMFVRPGVMPTPLHQKLCALPFRAALTTNYDELLEKTYSGKGPTYTHQDSEDLLVALRRSDFFLLKLYGTLSRPSSVLIAPMQYERALESNRLFARFMESLFYSRSLLFLGASLDGIDDYLSSLKLTGQASRAHYALVQVYDVRWEAKAEALRRRFGIQVLPFTSTPGFPELETFVDTLTRAVDSQRALTPPPPAADKERGSLIKRIQLVNIGPFDNFEVDLDPHWNVLLGDNGVGKSSILRGVAAALAGLEARPYAARLVRSGQSRGTVALETARGRYVVELFRGEGEAEMKVNGASPLSTESWLAVGFPALRALTWSRADVRERFGLERGNPTDLLPLIRNEPDPRFDKLKAWILELDHLGQRARADGQSDTRYLRQIEMLFEVITALTPGLRLEYQGVDPVTREVRVRTDDGVVPIECISQGTSSLFGWIGVMLQRMFDVHPESDTPWNEPALVLIDEVDAHMHPAWQQLLGPRIRELFPRLQLIATSHSPLIVTSLRKEEVLVLHRVKQQLRAERPSVDMKGYRADQVLTSHLFGLDSTLAPETQQALRTYTELSAKEEPTDAEQRTLASLAKTLQVRLPSPLEREDARRAYQLIRESLDGKLREVPAEQKQRILDEVKAQLQESVTGSHRPS